MTANATINVASVQNATIVPIAALQWHPAAGQFKGRKTSANAATNSGNGNPWGATGSAGSSTVVAGTRGRVFVQQGKTIAMIPVNIQMISGTNAAVTPIRGTLPANTPVIVAGGASATHARAATKSASPLSAQPSGVRIGGGGYSR
jgi:hypothetical protein